MWEVIVRTLAVAVTAVILTSVTPTVADAISVPSAARVLAIGGRTGIAVEKTSKSKGKNKSSSESVTINDIASVKHGKQNFQITASVAKTSRTCELKVKWHNGDEDSPDPVAADSNKNCTMTINVPDDAAGDAKATVTVKDNKGNKVASDSKTFTFK